MFNKEDVYAVVGATKNEDKYGYKVLRYLKDSGHSVIPVNLKEEEIIGLKSYHKISEIPGRIDVVVFVVPPAVSEAILPEAESLGVKKIWFQPGSESPTAIEYCKEHGMEFVHGACIMMGK